MNGFLGANKCTSIAWRSCGLADTAGGERFTIIEKVVSFYLFFLMWMEAGPLVCTHAFVQTLEEEKKNKTAMLQGRF